MPATSPTAVSRAQLFDAVSEQNSFVGALRSWRATLRGQGKTPRRDLWKRGTLALSLGQVNAPDLAGFGAGAGTALGWKTATGACVEVGTTSRPAALDQTLASFDALLSESPNQGAPVPLDRSSLTWLRARPLSRDAMVEATFLRARRDEGEWTSATFGNVNARLALANKWNARGTWHSAQLDEQPPATSWNAGASGPVNHLFGQANANINWRHSDAGFATPTATNETAVEAQMEQPIQTPIVSGTVGATLHTLERTGAQVQPGAEVARESSAALANLRLRLLPNLALRASGNLNALAIERAAVATRENTTGAIGDVGVEIQVSRALSLEAGAGRTQTVRESDLSGELENRATLRVHHRTGGGHWLASLQTRDRTTSARDDAQWTRLARVQLEGERRLIGSLRLRAGLNWMLDRGAAQRDSNSVARLAQAQLQLSRAARFDVRVRDGAALPGELTGKALGALFGSSSFANGQREIATRFNIAGEASGQGLGVALEWARRGETRAPNDSWKIGVTYR